MRNLAQENAIKRFIDEVERESILFKLVGRDVFWETWSKIGENMKKDCANA